MWMMRNTEVMAPNIRWRSVSQGMVGRRPSKRDGIMTPTRSEAAALSQATSPAERLRYQKT